MDSTLVNGVILDAFTQAFLAAALWAETDGEEPLDSKYSLEDFSSDTLLKLAGDCEEFQRTFIFVFVNLSAEQAGHDFWLTRNRHGSGFWDRDNLSNELRDRLTEASHAYGEVDLYVGDDGKIHM